MSFRTIRLACLLTISLHTISITRVWAEDDTLSDILDLYGLDHDQYFNAAHKTQVIVEPAQYSTCRNGSYCVEPWWFQDYSLEDYTDSSENSTAEVSKRK